MPLARETRARAEARAFAVQVLVVLLVNELRLECPFKALERIVPVLGTILTNGLRALWFARGPSSMELWLVEILLELCSSTLTTED